MEYIVKQTSIIFTYKIDKTQTLISEKANRDVVTFILVAIAHRKITLQQAILPRGICLAEINNATEQRFMCREMDDFDIPYCRKTSESKIHFPAEGLVWSVHM